MLPCDAALLGERRRDRTDEPFALIVCRATWTVGDFGMAAGDGRMACGGGARARAAAIMADGVRKKGIAPLLMIRPFI